MPGKRIQIPKVLLKEFELNRRIVLDISPAGLWPIGPEILKNAAFMKKLANDAEFRKNFEVVIIQK
jgi:hypothetical protein